VDQIVTVSEQDLEDALVGLVTADHVIAEGAGAAAPAALVGKRVNVTKRRVVAIVSGANIDRQRLVEVLSDRATI
jgi:threonine dehydratase